MSSPVRENIETWPCEAMICTRMPSHFHSAANSAGSSSKSFASSTAFDSISGWNRAAWSMSGRGALPSSQAKSAA